jgi:cell fate regulator YaaT (PSP1 superfamily)
MTEFRNIWSTRSSAPQLWVEDSNSNQVPNTNLSSNAPNITDNSNNNNINNNYYLKRHSYSGINENFESKSTMNLINDYFTKDPHNRIKVTVNLLNQRFFDEKKLLSDNYRLPKFPIDNSIRNYQLVLVGFKAGRIDVFYLPCDNKLLKNLQVGDLVVVEADRGKDLGMIFKMNISIDEARLVKSLHFQEQQSALSDCDLNDEELSLKNLSDLKNSSNSSHPPTLHFPKPILYLAQPNEILQILNKNQDEEKACRLCLGKIANATILPKTSSPNSSPTATTSTNTNSDLSQMKLIDAEYQFDRKKLIFYYSASKRIDFRDLVRELFRIYKTRIWMCAVNGLPYVLNVSQNTSPILSSPNSTENIGNLANGRRNSNATNMTTGGNFVPSVYSSMPSYNSSEQVPILNDSFQTPRVFMLVDYNNLNSIAQTSLIPRQQQQQQQQQQQNHRNYYHHQLQDQYHQQPLAPIPTNSSHCRPSYLAAYTMDNNLQPFNNLNKTNLNSQHEFFQQFHQILDGNNHLIQNNRRQLEDNYTINGLSRGQIIPDSNSSEIDLDAHSDFKHLSSESFVLKSLVDSINL